MTLANSHPPRCCNDSLYKDIKYSFGSFSFRECSYEFQQVEVEDNQIFIKHSCSSLHVFNKQVLPIGPTYIHHYVVDQHLDLNYA